MKIKTILVVLFLILFSSPCSAGEKIIVALIDFTDMTPNKMALSSDDVYVNERVQLSQVMKIVRDVTEKFDLFELMPIKSVTEAMNTGIGKEAVARKYDRFSSVRLGKILKADALLIGEILQFKKDYVPRDFNLSIIGIDLSNKIDDVVIRAQLINVHNGEKLADIIGSGNTDESVLETISSTITNRLSAGFLEATKICMTKILRELQSADIKIYKTHYPVRTTAETADFFVTKIEGNYIYINAGRDKDVLIADLFNVLKDDSEGGQKLVAVYSVTNVESNAAKLVLVESKETEEPVSVSDKVKRKTR